MAIFLTILKIIGIVLLCIIGLVLFIILYVLLAPFWFKVQANVNRDMDFFVKVKATTFLHFIQVHVNFDKENGLNYDATVLGSLIKIFPKGEKKSDAETIEDTGVENTGEDIEATDVAAVSEDSGIDGLKEVIKYTPDDWDESEAESEAEREAVSEEQKEAESEAETASETEEKKEYENESESEEKTGIIDKIKAFFHKLNPKTWIEALKKKLAEIKETVNDLKGKGTKILGVLRDNDNKAWLKKIFTQLKKLIKSMGINMRGTNLDFSAGEPDTTGLVCGALSLFPPIYDKRVRILPDFADDNLYLDGNVFIKGRIQLVFVVYFVLVILLDANTKKILNTLKNL